jgi:hypothetical protein
LERVLSINLLLTSKRSMLPLCTLARDVDGISNSMYPDMLSSMLELRNSQDLEILASMKHLLCVV